MSDTQTTTQTQNWESEQNTLARAFANASKKPNKRGDRIRKLLENK